MTRFMWKFGGTVFAALIGVTMLNYGLERVALERATAALAGESNHRGLPIAVTLTVFVGLVGLLLGAYGAFRLWVGYIVARDNVRQLPLWFVWTLLAFSGAVGLWAFLQHAAFLADAPFIPQSPNFGYVFFVTLAGTLFALAVVALLVRAAVAAARR